VEKLNNKKQKTMRNLLIILTLISSFTISSCKGQLDTEVKNISVEEMQSLLKMDEVQLVDVRTPKEYESGYIANSQNIDYMASDFDEAVKVLNKEFPVILYCRSGRRSADGSKKLLKAGFVEVYNLEGGIIQWQKELK
jgi:rhodanese-related sulfurtransferase